MSDLPAQPELPKVDPRLIDELFSMDPLKLSDQDIDVIVAELRRNRLEHLAAAAAPKARKAPGEKTPKSDQIDLASLGLL